MHRDQGSNQKHFKNDQNHHQPDEAIELERGRERQGWVRKYLDLADRAFRDDSDDPTPTPA